MEQTLLLFRTLFLTGCGVAGWYIARIVEGWSEQPWLGAFLGLALGLGVILADRLMKGISLRAFSSATFGLILGCVLATLVLASGLFKHVSEDMEWVIRLVIYLVFGYLGTMLALRSNRDEFSLIIPYVRLMRSRPADFTWILDTSAIIDGRIADLCKSGYVEGTLVVPRFVLKELQDLGESPDSARRQKGRRGLDLLNELRALPNLEMSVHESDENAASNEARYLHLASLYQARLVTTNYNLGRIAEIQKVRVLNVHQLAGALRIPLIAGERLMLRLIREGKDPHQGVGFLADGTMLVVNHAREMIGREIEVVITSSIMTSAGRMAFGELASSHAENLR
ncbi:MAG: twitching motility protein PilT [Verrucomicrobiae bacterium]|nr:twitching motility protein PilT [Verrucomicrobiae bacterium]